LEEVLNDKEKSKTGLLSRRDAKGVFKNNVRKLLGKKESSKTFVGIANAVLKKSQTIR
jgi:hypothetical protein